MENKSPSSPTGKKSHSGTAGKKRLFGRNWNPSRLPFLFIMGGACLISAAVGAMFAIMVPLRPDVPKTETTESSVEASTWTCSMHPQIQLPRPGKCPICSMDLIPLRESTDDQDHPRRLVMSKTAQALASIRTEPAERRYATRPVRMVGTIEVDETRLADVTARVPGRLDRLFVDYTGIPVREGDHLVSLYSPELIVAQRELLSASKAFHEASAGPDGELAEKTLRATEEKLRLWGLLPRQIEEIYDRGRPSDHITLFAPVGGIVVRKHVNEGVYVETGTKIYTIADLSRVWVLLDAYETDLPWLRYGQDVEFTTESIPGEVFQGRVTFIDPVLDKKTRTIHLRVNAPNPDERLKPGMYVRAMVRSRLGQGGQIVAPSLAGKWISPMHPEIIKDGPGKCDVCGMDLVPAEELGLAGKDSPPEKPLVIPATAPLVTGRRAVVYVEVPDQESPTYEGREVRLGPRAGDYYLVREGLEEGERVVVKGNFKLDADLQIQAKPSMMSTETEPSLVVPETFRRRLDAIYDPYLRLQTALGDDRIDDARASWKELRQASDSVPEETLDPRVGEAWQSLRSKLDESLELNASRADSVKLRERFEQVAKVMLEVADRLGHAREEPLFEAFCPMAFNDRGAAWLQSGKLVDNPYFGHEMRRCGLIRREFSPSPPSADAEEEAR